MQQEQIRLRLTLNRKIVLRIEIILCMANLGVLVIYCLYFHSFIFHFGSGLILLIDL